MDKTRIEDDGGKGHPLPASTEARTTQVPEHMRREKGEGDDAPASAAPGDAVGPDGETYPTATDS
jgi:hypothetical protein